MKICPRCRKTYTDENLNFCLDDGAGLVSAQTSNNVIPATVLIEQSRPNERLNQPFGNQSDWNPNQKQFAKQPARKSNGWLWAIGIFVGVILLCGGGVTGFLLWAANLESKNREIASDSVYNSNAASSKETPNEGKPAKVQRIDLSKWIVVSSSGLGNTEFANGEFIMTSKQKGFYYVLVSTKKYQTENAATKVTVRNVNQADTKNLGFGLIFHSDPTPLTQDYAFLIDSEKKRFRVVRHEPREEISIIDWTYSAAIRSGTEANVLEVRDRNNKMSFYINEQLVTTLDDTDGFVGGVPGLYVSHAVPIAFSDFEVKK